MPTAHIPHPPNDSSQDNRADSRFLWTVTALTLLALAMRLYALGAEALWSDEAMIAFSAEQTTWNAIYTIYPFEPLYTFAIKYWLLLGQSAWWMRIPSVLFGVLLVPAMAWAASSIAGRRAGIATAIIAAFNPFLFFYAQDAKMYVWIALLYIVMTGALVQFSVQSRTLPWIIVYAVFAVALGYTHRLAGLYIGGVSIAYVLFLARDRARIVQFLLASAAVFVACLPYVVALVIHNIRMAGFGFWVPPPTPWSIYITVSNMAVGYTPMDALRVAASLALGALIVAALVVAPAPRRFTAFYFTAAAIPIAVLYLLPIYSSNSLYVDRYLITSGTALLLAGGLGLAAIPGRLLRRCALGVVIATYAYGINDVYQRRLPEDGRKSTGVFKNFPTVAITEEIQRHAHPQEQFFHVCRHTRPEMAWHMPQLRHVILDVDYITQEIQERVAKQAEIDFHKNTVTQMDGVPPPAGRFWLVVPEPGAYGYAGIPPAVFPWMLDHGELVWAKHYGGDRHHSTWLYLFDPEPLRNPASEAAFTLPVIAKAHHAAIEDAGEASIRATIVPPEDGETPRDARVSIDVRNHRGRPQLIHFTAIERGHTVSATQFTRAAARNSAWERRMFRDAVQSRFAIHRTVRLHEDSAADPLSAALNVTPGRYGVYIERVLEGTAYRPAAAPIELEIDGHTFDIPGTTLATDGGWNWVQAGHVDHRSDAPIHLSLIARPKPGHPESFATIARILLLPEDESGSATSAPLAPPVLARFIVRLEPHAQQTTGFDIPDHASTITLITANEHYSATTHLSTRP